MTAAWLGDPAESRARSTTPTPGPSFFAPALFVSRGRPLGRSARTPCARAVSAARDSATRAELTRTRPFVHAARGCASRWVRRVMTASTDFDGAIRGDSRDPRRFGRVERPAVLRHHGWLTDDLDRRSDRRMVTHVAILCTTHSARSPPGPPLRPPPAPTHDPPALTPAAVLGLSPSGAIASAPLDGADIASTSARVAAATTFRVAAAAAAAAAARTEPSLPPPPPTGTRSRAPSPRPACPSSAEGPSSRARASRRRGSSRGPSRRRGLARARVARSRTSPPGRSPSDRRRSSRPIPPPRTRSSPRALRGVRTRPRLARCARGAARRPPRRRTRRGA